MDNNNYFKNGQGRRPRGASSIYLDEPLKKSAPRSGGYKRPQKRRTPLAFLIVIDVILAALLLGIFYVTNYEMHEQTSPIESLPAPSWLASKPPETAPAITSASPDITERTPGQTPGATVDPNDWRAKFADKFTDGAVEQDENGYKSANINISIQKVQKDNITYFVADIYVGELKYFKTAFPKKADVMGEREFTDTVAKEVGAILAINGDHCVDNPGPVVRNGQLYRNQKSSLDVLLMNYDGSMQTLSPEEFDIEKVKTEGAYQVWAFGPMLLKDGQPMTDFNMPDTIGGANPRTAVGYYEPGHYCFVLVDGRQPGYSEGMTLKDLSQLMADLGCTAAYNMDGGRSAEMAYLGELKSHPMDGRRSTTDILYIGEE